MLCILYPMAKHYCKIYSLQLHQIYFYTNVNIANT